MNHADARRCKQPEADVHALGIIDPVLIGLNYAA
jgi:hypothetical protein